MEKDLENWQRTQGYIVTGGGLILKNSSLYTDFLPSDLPHYLLTNDLSHEAFRRWKEANRRSHSIVGCWSRPIFAGGWQESSSHDTEAYNLQTPSLFIDMRFPLKRPTNELKGKGGLSDCFALDLQVLARQHCFCGYSLPEILPREQHLPDQSKYPVFTRHHVIDWNLHPNFPRNRPNRWWVEINDDGEDNSTASFKEHSIIRNKETSLPVYFERWIRVQPFIHQRFKYFAARKIRKNNTDRDAVLILVGVHFALVVDRDMRAATAPFFNNSHRLAHLLSNCNGGGASYIDYLLNSELHDADMLTSHLPLAREYLDLEGSYGLVNESTIYSSKSIRSDAWTIRKSTHPWKEGENVFHATDKISLDYPSLSKDAIPTRISWCGSSDSGRHRYGDWEVFECSFTKEELNQIFPTEEKIPVPSYLSLFSKL